MHARNEAPSAGPLQGVSRVTLTGCGLEHVHELRAAGAQRALREILVERRHPLRELVLALQTLERGECLGWHCFLLRPISGQNSGRGRGLATMRIPVNGAVAALTNTYVLRLSTRSEYVCRRVCTRLSGVHAPSGFAARYLRTERTPSLACSGWLIFATARAALRGWSRAGSLIHSGSLEP